MPAETHQHGQKAGSEEVVAFLSALLSVDHERADDGLTLHEVGVHDDHDLWDLWDAAREEFGERTLSPEDVPFALTPSMTIAQAAEVLSSAFGVPSQPPEFPAYLDNAAD